MTSELIPNLISHQADSECFDFSRGFRIDAGPELDGVLELLARGLDYYGIKHRVSGRGNLALTLDSDMAPSQLRMEITTKRIKLSGGDCNSLCRAVGALLQQIALAMRKGGRDRLLKPGTWTSVAHLQRRSVLLDCSRQFVSVRTIKALMSVMAQLGLNFFHWHLCDNQGWRYESRVLPGVEKTPDLSDGIYSRKDIAEIRSFASQLGIEIIPELELPAHAGQLLRHYPEYSCTPDNPGEEICLGNPASLQLGKKLLREMMDLFPESRWIHLGGDEAVGDNWRQCPRCQKAAAAYHGDMREAEFHFMCQLAKFVTAVGRTPIIWGAGTGRYFPPGCVIQVWLAQNEGELAAKQGLHSTFSYHPFLYLDYPETAGVPQYDWMCTSGERTVLHANPWCCGNGDGKVDGVEACIWTEVIPEWRISLMCLPRLLAVAEVACHPYEERSWYDYLERRERLEGAGYLDYLRSLFLK